MKCEKCGKELCSIYAAHTVSLPVSPIGYEHHKVCSACNNEWDLRMIQEFHKWVKEGDKNERA